MIPVDYQTVEKHDRHILMLATGAREPVLTAKPSLAAADSVHRCLEGLPLWLPHINMLGCSRA